MSHNIKLDVVIIMVKARDNREKGGYSSSRKSEGGSTVSSHGDNRNHQERP
jgi:hypothetical protein